MGNKVISIVIGCIAAVGLGFYIAQKLYTYSKKGRGIPKEHIQEKAKHIPHDPCIHNMLKVLHNHHQENSRSFTLLPLLENSLNKVLIDKDALEKDRTDFKASIISHYRKNELPNLPKE